MGQIVDQLVSQGYGGYAGWDDGNAQADFNAGHGEGKRTDGGTGAGGAGVPPPFNFDYAAEATKAYGELGPYYMQLLQWAQGDMNKVLSRLTEDYDKGVRRRKEDTATANQALDVSEKQTNTNIENSALARGLYQKSLDANASEQQDPQAGFGIPDVNFAKSNANFKTKRDALGTNLTRYIQNADTIKARGTQDATEAESRKAYSLEDERKLRSGDIANQRGSRAYQDYINKYSLT